MDELKQILPSSSASLPSLSAASSSSSSTSSSAQLYFPGSEDDNINNSIWSLHIDELGTAEGDPRWKQLLAHPSFCQEDRDNVLKFLFFDDQRRALGSLLLQRALVRSTFHCSDEQFLIRRTPEGKPYLARSSSCIDCSRLSSWNYNVSHHGHYVCIASDVKHLIGVDIVDISTRNEYIPQAAEFIRMFEKQLTKKELALIFSQDSEDKRYTMFFLIWALKEAYIKAIGSGLAFSLQNICFEVHNDDDSLQLVSGTATLTVDDLVRLDWRFDFFQLDPRHIVAVARGPISDAIESFRRVAFNSEVTDNKETLTAGSYIPRAVSDAGYHEFTQLAKVQAKYANDLM